MRSEWDPEMSAYKNMFASLSPLRSKKSHTENWVGLVDICFRSQVGKGT